MHKKSFILALFLAITAGLFIGFKNSNAGKDLVFNKAFEGPISMNSSQFADQSFLIAPYKTVDTFLSDEEKADFKFTAVGLSWKEDVIDNTNVQLEMQFKIDGNWTQWMEMEEEAEIETEKTINKYTFVATNPSEAVKYRFMLYGDGVHTPVVSERNLTFLRTAESKNKQKVAAPKFADDKISPLEGDDRVKVARTNVVLRSQWGADEELRYLKESTKDADLVTLPSDFYTKFADELKLSQKVKEDVNGRQYVWPLEYPEKIRKVIVHHTATTGNLKDPKQAIRDIYYYHAISRGWGDIGYNYIVDRDGVVYEGRFGGEGVIGAHAGAGNNGSIGIAVLGSYQDTEVPAVVLTSLSKLVGEKTGLHKILPTGTSSFRGNIMPNIFGHRDIMATSCPGTYLYDQLPTIRSLANVEYKKRVSPAKFKVDYAFIDQSEGGFVDLGPKENKSIEVVLENIGKVNWDANTYLAVKNNSEVKTYLTFPAINGEKVALMKEKEVKPGEKATFKVEIKSSSLSNRGVLELMPVFGGKTKSTQTVEIPYSVQQPTQGYSFVDMKKPPKSMQAGETFSLKVRLKNTGNTSWKRTGDMAIKLMADQPRERKSVWVSNNSTLATLNEAEVKPGEIGSFTIALKAPQKTGYYKEYFTPVLGQNWLKDSGMNFAVTVVGANQEPELVAMSPQGQLVPGSKYLLWFTLRNVSNTTWKPDKVQFDLVLPPEITMTKSWLISETAPGNTGKFYFEVQVSKTAKTSTKMSNIAITPKIDGTKLLSKPIYFDYKIVTKEEVVLPIPQVETPGVNTNDSEIIADLSSKEPKLRVKLAFAGEPEITANKDFSVMSGGRRVASVKANEAVKITEKNGSYLIEANGKRYSKSTPVRVVPQDGGIVEIKNYINPPAWNPSLNDNQYRGALEVNMENDKLIVINELLLEDYLKGIGEVGNGDHPEKIKSIMVAARTYALFYITVDKKFAGKPYDLDDNPDRTQKYIGYGFEKRAPNIKKAVDETRGQVVWYQKKLVKTPYFNESDGVKTKSAEAVWKWKDTPYLIAVDDKYCTDKKTTGFSGHGVGLSGCGATGMAKSGFSYVDIIKHYYVGAEIATIY